MSAPYGDRGSSSDASLPQAPAISPLPSTHYDTPSDTSSIESNPYITISNNEPIQQYPQVQNNYPGLAPVQNVQGFYDPGVPQTSPAVSPMASQPANAPAAAATPDYVQPTPAQKPGEYPKYDIYSINRRVENYESIQQVANDPGPAAAFWQNEESFSPTVLERNIQYSTKFNDTFWIIPYIMFLVISFSLFVLGCNDVAKYDKVFKVFEELDKDKQYKSFKAASKASQLIAWIYLFIFFALIFTYGLQYFAPDAFGKYGVAISMMFIVFATIIPCLFELYGSIGITVTMLLVGFFWLFVARRKNNTDGILTGFVNKLSINTQQIIVALEGVFLHLITFIFHAYSAFGAYYTVRSKFLYAYLMLSCWFMTQVHANIIFTLSSALGAARICRTNAPLTYLNMRVFLYSFGSICKITLFSFLDRLRDICNYDQTNAKTETLESVSKLWITLSLAVKALSAKILEFFDTTFGYMSRYGLVYVGLYGISADEACVRMAEQQSKRFLTIPMAQKNTDTTWTFKAIAIATVAGYIFFSKFLTMSSIEDLMAELGMLSILKISKLSTSDDSYSSELKELLKVLGSRFRLHSGIAWFAVWCFFYQLRMQVDGINDAVITIFGEAPSVLRAQDNDVFTALSNTYAEHTERELALLSAARSVLGVGII